MFRRILMVVGLVFAAQAQAAPRPAWANATQSRTFLGRIRVGAIAKGLEAIDTNKPVGPFTRFGWTQPVALAFQGSFGARATVAKKVAAYEALHGKLGDLTEADVPDLDLYKGQLITRLSNWGFQPGQVSQGVIEVAQTDFTIPASEGIAATKVSIEPRRVFFEKWTPPAGKALSGRVYQLNPGFMMDKASFDWMTKQLTDQGHVVIAWDHQFVGLTTSPRGRKALGDIDSVFGLGRDGLAMQHVSQAVGEQIRQETGIEPVVTQLGVSLGGGPTIIGGEALLSHGITPQIVAIDGAPGRNMSHEFKVAEKVNLAPYSAFISSNNTKQDAEIQLVGRTHLLATFGIHQPDVIDTKKGPLEQRVVDMRGSMSGVVARAETLNKVIVPDANGVGMYRAVQMLRTAPKHREVGSIVMIHGQGDNLAGSLATAEAFNSTFGAGNIIHHYAVTTDHPVAFLTGNVNKGKSNFTSATLKAVDRAIATQRKPGGKLKNASNTSTAATL